MAEQHTITEFLEARYREIEAAAKAASFEQHADRGNHWQWGDQIRGRTATEKDGYLQGNNGLSPYVSLITVERYDVESIDAHFQVLQGTRVLAEPAEHIALHDPAYVLADIESKRKILERAEFVNSHGPAIDDVRALDMTTGAAAALRDVLKHLASVYSDHPDYQREWSV